MPCYATFCILLTTIGQKQFCLKVYPPLGEMGRVSGKKGEPSYPYIKALGFEEQAFKVGLIKGIEELTRL